MRHIKLVSYVLGSSIHDCECGLVPLISKGHHFPSCLSGFSTPKMVPIAYFEAVKYNKTMVKNETEVIITNIVYQYKPIMGAPLHWPGKKSLKDPRDSYNEPGNVCKRTGEEEPKKGIFTEIL